MESVAWTSSEIENKEKLWLLFKEVGKNELNILNFENGEISVLEINLPLDMLSCKKISCVGRLRAVKIVSFDLNFSEKPKIENKREFYVYKGLTVYRLKRSSNFIVAGTEHTNGNTYILFYSLNHESEHSWWSLSQEETKKEKSFIIEEKKNENLFLIIRDNEKSELSFKKFTTAPMELTSSNGITEDEITKTSIVFKGLQGEETGKEELSRFFTDGSSPIGPKKRSTFLRTILIFIFILIILIALGSLGYILMVKKAFIRQKEKPRLMLGQCFLI